MGCGLVRGAFLKEILREGVELDSCSLGGDFTFHVHMDMGVPSAVKSFAGGRSIIAVGSLC
jgi:hypothetical protein